MTKTSNLLFMNFDFAPSTVFGTTNYSKILILSKTIVNTGSLSF